MDSHVPDARTPYDRQVVTWLVLATLIAAGLRLYKLDEGSFWLDELFTINASARLNDMHNSKALGYIPTVLGLHLAGIDPSEIPPEPASWRSMGLTEYVVRLPTAIVGILTIPIVGFASVRLLGPRGAVLIALLLAVAPWHIYWSQAARFYILQFLFYTLSIVYYFVATRSDSKRCFVVAMACMTLAFLSQPTALIVLGVFALDWIVAQIRREPLRFGAFHWLCGIAAVSFCAGIVAYDIWAAPKQWTQFVEDGARHQSPMRMLLGAAYMIGPTVVAFAILSAIGLRSRDVRLVVYLVTAAIVPILAFTILSAWAFVGLRYSFVALYGWLALAAVGADYLYHALRPRLGAVMAWSPLAVIIAAMSLGNYIYFNSNGNFHARWRDAAEFVRMNREPGERVAASDVYTAEYYMEEAVAPLPIGIQEVRALTETTWFIVEVSHSGDTTGRFWLLPDAELREVFALRSYHVSSSVQIYRYEPRARDAED